MALTELEITLQTCLQKTGIRELPKEWTPSSPKIFIRAIALVRKVTGIKGYVICENDGDNNPIVKHDPGIPAAIASVEKIYPVEMLDKKYAPDLRSDKAILEFLARTGHNLDEIQSLLSKDDKSDEQIKADRLKIKSYVNKTAIKLAKMNLAEDTRCAEIMNYSKRIDNGEKKDK